MNENAFCEGKVDWIGRIFFQEWRGNTEKGNDEFNFDYFEFEMSFKYSGGDVERAVGYFRLGFRGKFPKRILKCESYHITDGI